MSTKKIRILIISLVAVLLVSIGAYVAVDTVKSREEQAAIDEANSLRLFNFDENSIDKVEIQNPEGHFIIDNTTDGWMVTETDYPYDFVLNSYYINSICTYLSDLTALKKLDATDLAAYGLDAPAVLTCYQGSTPYTLYIGNASATEEYYYVMLPDNPIIYSIDYNEGDVLYGGMTYLKDPYMLSYFDVNVNYVCLERGGKTAFEISKDSGGWHMSEPLPNAELNTANVSSMLTSLTRLQLESFVKMTENSNDLFEYQLDKPSYRLTVKTTEDETTTIDFADFDKNDGSVYLVYEETGQIATMASNSVGFLQTNASELLNSKLLSVTYANTAELAVKVDNLDFTMTMNHAENQYTFESADTDESIDISSKDSDVQAMFKSLFSTVANISYDSLDTETEPDTSIEPAAVFRYTLTDGTEREITLIPIDDTYYWAMLDGEYTGKIVRRRALSSNTGVLTYYEKLTDLLELSE